MKTTTITRAERRVLNLLSEGKTNKIIAHELGISEHTVKIHIRNMYMKTGVHNRIQLYIATRELYSKLETRT